MSELSLDDVGFRSFEQDTIAFEQLHQQFTEILDEHQTTLSYEAFLEENFEQGNPFLAASFEDERTGHGVTSATGGFGVVAEGLKNYSADKVKKGMGAAGRGLATGTKAGTKGLIAAVKAFAERMAKFINSVSMALSKTFATGLPLMGKILDTSGKLNALSKNAKQVEAEEIDVKKAAKYLALEDTYVDPSQFVEHLRFVDEVQKSLLSKDKLERFKEMSASTLEPYRDSIKGTKVDQVVFLMAVLGLITNPGVVVGSVLKKIFSAANPGLGEVADKTSKAVGGAMTNGVSGLLLALGTSSGPILKQIQNGRLNISAIPDFQPIYPFCRDKHIEENGFTILYKSQLMLGNYQWEVRDYSDQLTSDMKGSVSRLGAKFKRTTAEVKANSVKPLTPEQVFEITELVSSIMSNAQAYCKQWPAYAKTYNSLYDQISDIVMTYEPDANDEKKSMTVRYIRYSYRNAMNIILGGIWNNCFGSDNQFVRYLVGLCRFALLYSQKSIEANAEESESQPEEKEEKKETTDEERGND